MSIHTHVRPLPGVPPVTRAAPPEQRGESNGKMRRGRGGEALRPASWEKGVCPGEHVLTALALATPHSCPLIKV